MLPAADRVAPSRSKPRCPADATGMQRASSLSPSPPPTPTPTPATTTMMMTITLTGCERHCRRCSSLHRGAVEASNERREEESATALAALLHVIRLPATLLSSSATNDYTSARNLRNHGPAWVSPRQDALAQAARSSITTKSSHRRRALPAILKYAAGSRAATAPAAFTFLPLICNKEHCDVR